MIADATLWAIKFVTLSSVFGGLYLVFAWLRPAAAERFLLAKLLLVASPFLALLKAPSRNVLPDGFIQGDALARVVTFGSAPVAEAGISTDTVVLTLYALVALTLLVRLGLSLARMNRLAWSGRELETWRGIPVIEHDGTLPPATFGLLKSRIFLPKALSTTLSRRELELIYAHEAVHVSRFDFRWKLAARLLACFTFFSPAWLLLLRRFEEEMELSCDDLVRSDAQVPTKEYAGLLVRLAETAGDSRQVPVCSVSSTFGPSILRRVSAMKREVVKSRKRVVFALVALALVASAPVLLVGSADSLADSPSEVKLMDPKDGFILALKADVRSESGEKLKMEVSRVVHPGKRILLGGNDGMTVEFQYEFVDGDLETSWYLLNAERQTFGTAKVVVEPQHGAVIEGKDAQGKAKYSIEFWDVTKKRTITEAKKNAELMK